MAASIRVSIIFRPIIEKSWLTISMNEAVTQNVLCPHVHLASVRYGSFFNKKDHQGLYDSVTSVSNQGFKRGRASRGKLTLYQKRNSIIGLGKSGMVFPGLNSPIKSDGSTLDVYKNQTKNVELERGTSTEKEDKPFSRKRKSIPAIMRGYSGRTLAGRHVNAPDAIGDYEFKDFKTIVLSSKRVGNVTASQGNVYRNSVLVATGNGKGLIGIASAKGSRAVNNAINKAGQRLLYVDLCEGSTLHHNFYEKYHRTAVMAFKKEKGYGLVCHRVLKSLCELIGIKDMYAKVDGNAKNTLSLTRAFMNALLKQKSHQDLADEIGHHIVEYRPERSNFPVLMASPSEFAAKDFVKSYDFDYETYFFGNKVPYLKKKKLFYEDFHSYKRKLFINYKFRNQNAAKRERCILGLEPTTIAK